MDTYTRYGLDFTTPTDPTQGRIQFFATQSLRLCLPLQCSSRCAEMITRPSLSLCEVPLFTNLIKLILTQFHSKPVQTKTKDAHTTKYKFWGSAKMSWEPKTEMENGEKTLSEQYDSRKHSMALLRQKQPLQTLRSWIYSPIRWALPKMDFQLGEQ